MNTTELQFLNWQEMTTSIGSLVMVLAITQVTKSWSFIKSIPTQLWSYLVALFILYPAYFFTGQLTLSNAVLILFHGMLVALAANGGYDALYHVNENTSE